MRTGLPEVVRFRFEHMRGRLVKTLGRLGPEDLSWRPNEESNSIANLVLHTCGSLDQRLVEGVGGVRRGERDRDAEFAERGAHTAADLIERVEATFGAIDRLLADLPAERLDAPVDLGRGESASGTEVLVRMIDHTGEHLGQIFYIAKARLGDGFDSLSIPLRRPS